MNRAYNYNSYESNCRPVKIKNVRNEETDVVDTVADLIVRAASIFTSTAFKVCVAILCLVGFVGIIGGVESGNLSLGTAIVCAVFMIFIEILCLCPVNKKQDKQDK